MFRTALGAVDPMQDVAAVLSELTAQGDLTAAVRARFPGESADAEHMIAKALVRW
jgi:hypothetical protein